MKYFKYLFISLFAFFIFSVPAAAMPVEEYMETVDIFDITFYDGYEETFIEVGYLPSLYDISEDRFSKDESMSVSLMDYYLYNNGNIVGHSNFVFGSYVKTNADLDLDMSIINNNQPLFTTPGTLGVEVLVRGSSAQLVVTRSDNSLSTIDVPCNTASETTEYITIDNQYADVIRLQLFVNPYTSTAVANEFVIGSFVDYGYEFLNSDEPVDPEPPVVIPGDLNGTIMYMVSFIISIVNVLFILEIIPGVTVGYFILASMIMGLVFSFFFHRMN